MALSDTITGLSTYPLIELLDWLSFNVSWLETFVDAFRSYDDLQAYLGSNISRYWLIPLIPVLAGGFSPMPLLLGWFHLIVNPWVFLALIILPDYVVNPSE